MKTRKWIAYGATGLLGLGVFAGTATLAANAMELRTDDGAVLQEGAITHSGKQLRTAHIDTTGDTPSLSIVSAASPTTAGTPASAATPASVASAVSAPAPAPASPVSAASPASPASAASAGSD